MLSSERFLAWERPFIQKLRQAWGFQQHLEQPLTLIIDFYFKNRQAESDLDNCISGPKDCLQLAGVIANDKQIRRIVAEKHFGFEPSVELSLFNYEAGA